MATMTDNNPCRQKWPPSAAHKVLHPVSLSSLHGQQPPNQADIILWGLRGCMALKTLQCCGDASSPKQRSTLTDIYPLNPPPKNYIRLLGGLSPIHLSRHCGTWGLIWGIRGQFQPAAAMVVTVVVCVCSVLEHNHEKLLTQARRLLHCTDAET